MRVPLSALPIDPHDRRNLLRAYFGDKEVTTTIRDGAWHIELGWPAALDWYVDPKLTAGLEWWGATVSQIPFALRRKGRVQTSLFDTWTLWSWSQWLSSHRNTPSEVTILHVDDHKDMGAPRLYLDEHIWRSVIDEQPFNLADPESVAKAIRDGTISMGSFLTPFLHTIPTAQVRHLCQPPKVTQTNDLSYQPTLEPDVLLRPQSLRPAISFAASTETDALYRATPHLSEWLAALPDAPALLHIDMDYFSNRYDADSGWTDRYPRLDPPAEAIRDAIDCLVEALRNAGAASLIKDVAIAYSPGFFPAEFWEESDTALQAGLEAVLGS